MGISKNRGTPKWMVKIMENRLKMDDLGVPSFLETPQWMIWTHVGCDSVVEMSTFSQVMERRHLTGAAAQKEGWAAGLLETENPSIDFCTFFLSEGGTWQVHGLWGASVNE